MLALRAFVGTEMNRHDLGASGEIDKTSREAASSDMESEPAAAEPPWREQVTVRGMVAVLLISVVYTAIAMKLSLTTGSSPHSTSPPRYSRLGSNQHGRISSRHGRGNVLNCEASRAPRSN